MLQKLCSYLLYRKLGWKKEVTIKHPHKYIICLAPHTSNWDFVMGQLYMRAEGMKINFFMKKEWFFFPLGILFKAIGGIPVWRSTHSSMTDNMAEAAKKADTFHVCITPEGTRSLNPEWKKGAYYIALKAQIPLLLYGVDYQKKLIKCTKAFVPTGNVEEEMNEIKLYFKDFKGKFPEKFTIGELAK